MPVTAIPAIVPLSSSWTVQNMVGHIRVLINELDNERFQNANIRTSLNIAISHVAQLLNIAQEPWYQIAWQVTLENSNHFTGVPWINLATAVTPTAATGGTGDRTPQGGQGGVTAGNVIPSNLLWEIRQMVASRSSAQISGNVQNVWTGNLTRLSVNEVMNLQNNYNTQYRQSMCWVHSGSSIFVHQGADIAASNTDYVTPGQLSIIGSRNPLLDNIAGESATGTGWTQLIDLPDRHMRLAMLMTQKMCLEQLHKEIPASLDGEVANLSQQITNNVVAELQFEQGKRSKVDQGFQTR